MTGHADAEREDGPPLRSLVLLVDDCEDTRDLFAEYLGMTFDVAVAPDGATALARARELLPSAIVLDWSLPDMRGDVALAQLRSEGRTRAIPVVMVSGFDEPDGPSPRPWDAYFTKPCRPDALVARLQELVGRAAPSRPASQKRVAATMP